MPRAFILYPNQFSNLLNFHSTEKVLLENILNSKYEIGNDTQRRKYLENVNQKDEKLINILYIVITYDLDYFDYA